MEKKNSKGTLKTGGGVDLAFAIVVLAAYFATFSGLQVVPPIRVLTLIGLGIAYIANGIYTYNYCLSHNIVGFSLAYFLIQIGLGGGIVYLGEGVGFNAMLFLPLAGQSVILLSRNLIVIVNLCIELSYVFAIYFFSGSQNLVWQGLPILIAGQVFIVFFTQMAVNEEESRNEVERLVNELAEANKSLIEYAKKNEELAIIQERNRLAREIHDGLGHYLTTIHMYIQAANAMLEKKTSSSIKIIDILTRAQKITQDALVDVRKSVAALRISPGDNLPLKDRILYLVNGLEISDRAKIQFQLLGSERDLSPQADLTLYRATQEGIHNAYKHSQATVINIILDYQLENTVKLSIMDNGQGSENHTGGFGLLGLKERVSILNGELKIKSKLGAGFLLEVLIPE